MEPISVQMFRAGMGHLLDRVCSNKARYIVTRKGVPYVAVAPVPPEADIGAWEKTQAKVVRNNLAEVFGSVYFENKDLVIMRHKKPMALITSLRGKHPGFKN
ncbi:MAG: hypothetical protein P8Y96_06425 [Desulfuromonadales bacterium]|jgi:PHD/YefM family antitoxin component YafN of YafNO toxin-antitoxin module